MAAKFQSSWGAHKFVSPMVGTKCTTWWDPLAEPWKPRDFKCYWPWNGNYWTVAITYHNTKINNNFFCLSDVYKFFVWAYKLNISKINKRYLICSRLVQVNTTYKFHFVFVYIMFLKLLCPYRCWKKLFDLLCANNFLDKNHNIFQTTRFNHTTIFSS